MFIFFFWNFYILPSHKRVFPLIGITDYIGITSLGDDIFSIFCVFKYPRTMVSYHLHHCWLLFCRFWLFPPQKWVRPLIGITDNIGSTLVRNHISNIYHVFFLPEQWCRITITVDDCYSMSFFFVSYPNMTVITSFLSLLFVSSSWMSETTNYDHWLHLKYFGEQLY